MSDTAAPPALTLVSKLTQVMDLVAGVEKRGYNQHHKYHFVQFNDVYEATRKMLAERNILLLQHRVTRSREGSVTVVDWEFEFRDGDSGEVIRIPWTSEGQDTQDKGTNKAATAARKYFLITQFQIPVDIEDPDGGPAPQQRQRTQPQTKRPQRNAPAPAPSDDTNNNGADPIKAGIEKVSRLAAVLFPEDNGKKDRPSLYAWLEVRGLTPPKDPEKRRPSIALCSYEQLVAIYRALRTESQLREQGPPIGEPAPPDTP